MRSPGSKPNVFAAEAVDCAGRLRRLSLQVRGSIMVGCFPVLGVRCCVVCFEEELAGGRDGEGDELYEGPRRRGLHAFSVPC